MSDDIVMVCIDGEMVPDWMVGFNRAVELTGKSRSTIDRDTKSGKLPSIGAPGCRKYKVSDLQTIYGLADTTEPVQNSLVSVSPGQIHAALMLATQPLVKSAAAQAQINQDALEELRLIRQSIELLTERSRLPWWKRWFS